MYKSFQTGCRPVNSFEYKAALRDCYRTARICMLTMDQRVASGPQPCLYMGL